jgi:hypothetical protein
MPFEELRACRELARLEPDATAADGLRARAEDLAARTGAAGLLAG